MVKFIKVVNTVDKVLDCIPVASTIKNIGIFLYQLTHKVNKVANPVNTCWKDDIKIQVLSKDDFITRISMIPIVGNLTALAYHLDNAISKAFGIGELIGRPMGYLGEATRAFSWGLKKHSHEVVALCLARNPNRPEKKLKEALIFAAITEKPEIFKLILESRTTWSSDSIAKVLNFTKSTEIANIILEKYSVILTDKQVGSVIGYLAGNIGQNNYKLIELLINTFPEIDINEVGRGLKGAAMRKDSFDNICLLLDRFPQIKEEHIVAALKKASEEGLKDTIEVLLKKSPNLVKTQIEKLLENAASHGDEVILNGLLNIYKENIVSASIGKVLASATQSIYYEGNKRLSIIERLINEYPNLAGKDLEPAMEKAASSNIVLFQLYLNVFSQLKSENLQKILNQSVFIYGKSGRNRKIPNSYTERWNEVARLIQKKFPDMKAFHPFA